MSMFSKLNEIKDLRNQAKQLQDQLSQETVQADSSGGKINLIMDGNQKIVNIEISEELLRPEEKDNLEKGIKEAHNEAMKKVQRLMAQKMQSGDFQMPQF